MERAEINSLFDDFNENYIEKSISKKVKLSLEYFAHSYIIVDLRVNDYTYKSFSYEEIINYDSSILPYDPNATLEEFFQKWLEVPNKERNVYTGWELIGALKKYMYTPYPNETSLDDPLNLMFYILDERTDISRFDATKINHEWLTGLYNLRLTGECGNDFLARKEVILDLASCTYPREVKREIRTKMKFYFHRYVTIYAFGSFFKQFASFIDHIGKINSSSVFSAFVCFFALYYEIVTIKVHSC